MIVYFHASDVQAHDKFGLMMYRQRAKVFQRILGWQVTVVDGLERDIYDLECDPLYVVSLDERTKHVRGSFRYLPTTGPTLLEGSLAKLFSEPIDVSSPLIWECSRFAIDPDYPHQMISRGVSQTTSELMIAGCQLAAEAGITQIMAVYETHMQRVYRRAGWEPTPIEIQNGIAVGLWDVTEVALTRMKSIGGRGEEHQKKSAA